MNRDELERRVTHDLIYFNLIHRPIECMLRHDPGARLINLAATLLLHATDSGTCLSHVVARESGSRLLDHPMLNEPVRDRLRSLVDSTAKPKNPLVLFPAVNDHEGVLFRIELRDSFKAEKDDRSKKLDIHDSGWFARKNGVFIRDMLEVFGTALFDGIDPDVALKTMEIRAFTRQITKTSRDVLTPPPIAWNGLDSADLSAAIAVLTHFLGGVTCRIVATGRVENGRVRRIKNLKCKLALICDEVPDLDKVFIPKENEIEADGFDLPIHAVDSIAEVFDYLIENSSSSVNKQSLPELANYCEITYKSIPKRDPRSALLNIRIISRLYQTELHKPLECFRVEWAKSIMYRAFIHHTNFDLDYAENQYQLLRHIVLNDEDNTIYEPNKNEIRARHASALTALYRFSDAMKLLQKPEIKLSQEDPLPALIEVECYMLAGRIDLASERSHYIESVIKRPSETSRLAAYWIRLFMTLCDLESAQKRMCEVVRCMPNRLHKSSHNMYIRQCEVKLRYLMGQWTEALALAQQLQVDYRHTLHHHWPGVLWRRFGGLAALKLGQIDTARRLMLPDPAQGSPAPILKVHACAPLIDFRLDELERTDTLAPSFQDELAPLRWPPVAHYFAGDLRRIGQAVASRSLDDTFVSTLRELARKIYE